MFKSSFFMPLLALIAFAITGCRGKFNTLPVATGSPYEVYVVLPEGQWTSEAGNAIRNVFTSEMVGLPQKEQNFRFSFVDPQHFDNIIKPVRNIMFVEVEDIYTQPKFSFTRDVWSQGQMVLYLKTPDLKSLETFIPENKDVMINFFVNAEINRRVSYLRKNYNKSASEQLTDLLGVELKIPTELVQMKKRKDFFWISNSQALRMDLVVYSVPYTEEDAFSLEKIIARRDSIMKYNIPGSVEGSYMTTSKFVDPTIRVLNFNNKYVAEVRGLWEVEGDAMGGPFVSHTRLDEVNNRIITVEAFIYSPKKNKRNNLRQMEAALYTLQLPQETELPEIPVVVGYNEKNDNLPVATGSPYEVFAVLPEDQWNSEAGNAIRNVFTSEMVGLSQKEQNFKFSFVDPQHLNNIKKPGRNIMFVEVRDDFTQPKFSFTKDLWSQDQMVLYLKTPDLKSLETFIPENKDFMIDFFVNAEINRSANYLRKNFNRIASVQLSDLLGVDMKIPTELVLMKKRKDFFWISNNQDLRMDLVVYSVPYTEEDAFSLDKIIARRNSIMKNNIPGSVEGSYMTTSKFIDSSIRVLNFNNKYVAEVRGLWEVEGDAMGGPFVSHTRLDEVNNRIITVEAFIYSPNNDKRDNLRQMEAALYTLQLPQETELPEIPVVVS